MGFDATGSPWGLRTDVSVDHMNGTRLHNGRNETMAASGDITVWSANLDLKLRIPTPGGRTRTHFYALGGLGAHRLTGGIYGTTDPRSGTNVSFANSPTRLGWNAGGGAAIAWGPAEVFIESRFLQVKTDLRYHMSGGVGTYSSFTPVLLGVQWF
jgi:opacity protein-like surface antigen